MEATVEKKKRAHRQKYHRPCGGILLNEAELAKALGESRRTVRSWWHSRTIPGIVIGWRTVRFRLDAVLDSLSKREVKAAGEKRKAGPG